MAAAAVSGSAVVPAITGHVDLPQGLLKEEPAFAMDLGGSLIKLVYVTGDVDHQNKMRIHLAGFSRECLDDVFAYIDTQIIVRALEGKTIYTTGLGGNQFEGKLKEKFGSSVHNLIEMDCFVKALLFLHKTLPEDELYVNPSENKYDFSKMHKLIRKMTVISHAGSDDPEKDDPGSDDPGSDDPEANLVDERAGKSDESCSDNHSDNKDEFPLILIMLGSAFGAMKVERDGTFELVDACYRGGRTLFGLGRLLTGAENFNEMIDMAEKGDASNVSTYGRDVIDYNEESHYTIIPEEALLYCFGKTPKKELDDFKKEDIAAALVDVFALDLVQMLMTTLPAVYEVKHVVLAGNFVVRQYVRDRVSHWMTLRTTCFPQFAGLRHSVVQHGGFLGAMGALIHGAKVDTSMDDASGIFRKVPKFN